MVRSSLRAAGLVVALLLLVRGGAVRGQEATPGIGAGDPAASATVVQLVASTLPGDLRPRGEATLRWTRVEWESGARLVNPEGTNPAGVNVSYVLAGTIELHVAGELLVGRAVAGEPTGALQPAASGAPVTLGQGDLVAFPNGAARHTRNIGSDRARIISVQIVTGTSDPFAPATGDGEVSEEILGTIAPEEWAAVPDGKLVLELRRTLLPPGAALPAYRVTPAAPELLAVEAGLMELGFDYDSDGAPDQWLAAESFMPPNELLAGVEERFIRASTSPPMFNLEDLDATDPDTAPEPDPLVFMSLAVAPVGGAAGAAATGTPAAEPSSPVGDDGSGCGGADEWAATVRDRVRGLAATHGAVLSDDPDAVAALPADAIRRAANDVRAVADELAASTPPAAVAGSNDALVGVLRVLADAADDLAIAVESGDPATIADAAANLGGFVDFYRGEVAAAATSLAVACPDLTENGDDG